jgi:hypothetical protein
LPGVSDGAISASPSGRHLNSWNLNRAGEIKGNAPPTNYYRGLCVLGDDGGRWTLLLAAFGLFAVAGYESYMTLVWEKTVSAAIRLDILVIDFPIMFISIIAGVLAWSKKPVNPQKQRKDEGCKDKLEE